MRKFVAGMAIAGIGMVGCGGVAEDESTALSTAADQCSENWDAFISYNSDLDRINVAPAGLTSLEDGELKDVGSDAIDAMQCVSGELGGGMDVLDSVISAAESHEAGAETFAETEISWRPINSWGGLLVQFVELED